MSFSKLNEIPLSLYIHVPWCEKKCPYCDFNSHENKTHFDESAYVAALLADLDQDMQWASRRPLQSIFIGGGTPSLFSGNTYKALFKELGVRFDLSRTEVTLEANPSSSECDKFAAYREAGINRLSIGVQSFNDDLLKKIGRVHNAADTHRAASAAKQAGFDNFNLDIMYALPSQTLEQSQADIQLAIEQQPTHLSCYQLTLEPNTLFFKNPPKLPNSERAWDMQIALQTQLATAGYQQYEVSAYAQEGKQCAHNLNYWQFGDYLAIGAGAHGKITRADGTIYRYWKQKQPKQYLNTAFGLERLGAYNQIETKALPFEFMLNVLRLKNGFQIPLFLNRTGVEFSMIEAQITQHIKDELIVREGDQIQPTNKGFQFIDSMLNDYL